VAFDLIQTLGELRSSIKAGRAKTLIKPIQRVSKGSFVKRGSRLGKVTLNNGVFLEVRWLDADVKLTPQRSILRANSFKVVYHDSLPHRSG